MESQRIAPAPLKVGDTIGIIAPAGVVDRERLTRAVDALHHHGFHTKTYRDVFAREGFLAGDDVSRAAELHAAFEDPDISAVFPARGGYGCLRLLEQLDFELIGANPKLFVGFSDNTVLHAAFLKHARLITFHGPHPSDSFGLSEGPTPLTEEWYWRFLRNKGVDYPLAMKLEGMHALRGGQTEGQLVGGNLALIGALLGTPHEPEFDGNILLIEDIGEPPYRVDRLLTQLRVAGKLQRVAGVLVGDFVGSGEDDQEIQAVIRERLGDLACPVLCGIPSGHGQHNVTLPLGTRLLLDADTCSVTFLERPTRVI